MNQNIVKIIFIISILFVFIPNSSAAENNYGIVSAWFNNEPATVEGISLKNNEPFTIKVEVESKIEGNVYVQLYEPGVTTAYTVIDGPSKINEWIYNTKIESGWKKTYIWKLKPDGDWTNGIAPINIFVQFNQAHDDIMKLEFTIANPYILDEQYSGSTPKPTPDPKSTDQPPSSKGLPGFGVVAALMGVAAVVLTGRRLH